MDNSTSPINPPSFRLILGVCCLDKLSHFCELENLHWSGSRSYSEIDEEFLTVKSKVNRIADLARRTVYAIRRNHNDVFGATPSATPVPPVAAAA